MKEYVITFTSTHGKTDGGWMSRKSTFPEAVDRQKHTITEHSNSLESAVRMAMNTYFTSATDIDIRTLRGITDIKVGL